MLEPMPVPPRGGGARTSCRLPRRHTHTSQAHTLASLARALLDALRAALKLLTVSVEALREKRALGPLAPSPLVIDNRGKYLKRLLPRRLEQVVMPFALLLSYREERRCHSLREGGLATNLESPRPA